MLEHYQYHKTKYTQCLNLIEQETCLVFKASRGIDDGTKYIAQFSTFLFVITGELAWKK